LLPGVHKLWVRGKDDQGNWGPASAMSVQINNPQVTGVDAGAPALAFLSQNTPNPFVARTNIRFGLPRAGRVELSIYDAQGRRIRSLVNSTLSAATHQIGWDGRDDAGARVDAGVYLYRLITPMGRFDRRLVVLD
jgi:hypothetical protein